jgi:hypothetical protein
MGHCSGYTLQLLYKSSDCRTIKTSPGCVRTGKCIKELLVEDPRWQLECRSRQHELHKSKILLRPWSPTWKKKTTKRNQGFDTLNTSPYKASLCHITQKSGGLPCCQMLAPNLLARHPADQEVSK